MNKTLIHLIYNDDSYKITLEDHIIQRISKYPDGAGRRLDITYDECPDKIKETILNKVEEILLRNHQ